MKKLIITLIVLAHLHALSKEQWFCTDDQALKKGNVYSICGIGEERSEGNARTMALDAAIHEFNKLCELTDDCKNHKIDIEPKRTSCEVEQVSQMFGKLYKCHRMFTITVGDSK